MKEWVVRIAPVGSVAALLLCMELWSPVPSRAAIAPDSPGTQRDEITRSEMQVQEAVVMEEPLRPSNEIKERDSSGGGGVILITISAASAILLFVAMRMWEKRRATWRLRMRHVCAETAALHARLVRLMQSVPSSAQWSDEAWSAGQRQISELAGSTVELSAKTPKGPRREGLWDLVAVLHALQVAIGDDPDARATPARGPSIQRRLRDLESATGSLEAFVG
jgi:hypothetical protein